MIDDANADGSVLSALPHSALYFGETRNHWWNGDHLALIAQRLRLSEVRSLLDVGCGVGHWGRLLLPLCHPAASLVGVDREDRSLEVASAQSPEPERYSYRQGDLRALPFVDGAFALVTCQTVLIHVADVRAALTEMERTLAPGGWLLLAEPNNLAGRAASLLGDSSVPVDAALEILRLQACCERGKAALGLGNNSIGETVVAHLERDHFDQLHTWQCDRPLPMIPPYRDPSARAALEEAQQFTDRDIWIWPKEETRRYFLAGAQASPGSASFEGDLSRRFEQAWQTAMAMDRQYLARLARQEVIEAGGQCLYLVAARKRR
ncbi:MAG: class I SAM-dependent methyltransferase [Deltaproteobacteria bacterium]